MAVAMSAAGGAAVIHRYNTIEEQVRHVVETKDGPQGKDSIVAAAVGISGNFLNRAAVLQAVGVDFFCVDVAHGHHILMKEAIETLRDTFGDSIHIMAGNVATLEGINDLADWGADSVRCNIGGGSICSTRTQTGHGLPGLQTIFECAKTDRNVAIIADGGIKTSGDIVKALAAGADAVMVGSLLAGTEETPGKVMEDKDGHRWKIYRGMASKEAQINWRGKYSSFEGVSSRVPYRGQVLNILEDLERGIRSGFSYSGAHNLSDLHAKATFVRQTTSGISESNTHIVGRNW
jgi:IMP dehydrogenase|tara:strand:+ start:1337 stop:2209 length:873 start_codon:yes stop_codon:yes gene_type:complete